MGRAAFMLAVGVFYMIACNLTDGLWSAAALVSANVLFVGAMLARQK